MKILFVPRRNSLTCSPIHRDMGDSRTRRTVSGLQFYGSCVHLSLGDSGIYDKEYLNYLRELFSLLPKYGISIFVCMHQDVWSRYSGGSGAPAWTIEAAGFDLANLEETGAAWLAGMHGGG